MSGEDWVPNIGPGQRRRRLMLGLVAWAAAAVTLGALVVFDAGRLARLVLMLPLWLGAVGFFQCREKT